MKKRKEMVSVLLLVNSEETVMKFYSRSYLSIAIEELYPELRMDEKRLEKEIKYATKGRTIAAVTIIEDEDGLGISFGGIDFDNLNDNEIMEELSNKKEDYIYALRGVTEELKEAEKLK